MMSTRVHFVWDEACDKVYEDIREYLTKRLRYWLPPQIILYTLALDHSLGAMFAQNKDSGWARTSEGEELRIWGTSNISLAAYQA